MTKPGGNSGQDIGRPRSFTDDEAFEAVSKAIKSLGGSRLTMGAIAKQLGCTAPALMSRFGSKSGLLRAYIEWGNRLTEEAFERAMAENESGLNALRARFSSEQLRDSHEFSSSSTQFNLTAFHVNAWSDPELHDAELERRKIFTSNIVKMLEKAKRDGEISGCDPQQLGRTMLAAVVGAAVQWDLYPTAFSTDRVNEVIEELLRPYLVDKT